MCDFDESAVGVQAETSPVYFSDLGLDDTVYTATTINLHDLEWTATTEFTADFASSQLAAVHGINSISHCMITLAVLILELDVLCIILEESTSQCTWSLF